jgi:hypothetical protein
VLLLQDGILNFFSLNVFLLFLLLKLNEILIQLKYTNLCLNPRDLIDVRCTKSLCDALLSSLLSIFGGLLEELEVNIGETGVEFKVNKKFYDLCKDPVFIFSPFLDGMFKLNWIDESSLPDLAKERLCGKIKQLILDQGVVIQHGYQNSVSVDTHLIQEQQLQEVQSSETSNATGFKRKCLFSNIHNDPNHPKKKPVDHYKFVTEELAHYLNDNI